MVFSLLPSCSSDGLVVIPDDSNDPFKPEKPLVFRIATYNVHNLFDTVCDSGACASGDYEKKLSASQYRAKIGDISKGIYTLDADIILLQEIEKESGLNDLIKNSVGYVGVFAETGRSASLDVAVMVRGKVIEHWLHRDALPFVDDAGIDRHLARELLEVEVELKDGRRIHVLVTHMISKVSDEPGIRRNGEARVIRAYLDELADKHPDRLIVFGGDLNDTPDSISIQKLIGDQRFTLCSADIPQADSFTYADKYAIDHLIYRNGRHISYVPKSTKRLCDISPGSGYGTSDHCPLMADFVSELVR